MKLKKKILITIGLVWLVFLVITYVGSRALILHSFLTLEKDRAARNLSRVDHALDQMDYSLYTFTVDWSNWDELYAFMQGKNPGFLANNLHVTTLVNSDINLFTYWNNQGKLIVGTAIDTNAKKLVAFPRGIQSYLYPGSALLDRKNSDVSVRGYALVDNKIMLIAASPITNSNRTQPSLGALVTGRVMTPHLLNVLKSTTRLNLEVYPLNEMSRYNRLNEIFKKVMNTPNGQYSGPLNENLYEGYSLIKDINEKPIGMIRMTMPRTIYLAGLHTIHYFILTFIALGVLFSLLMIWFLRVMLINRLEKLDQQVANISARHAIDKRVTAEGNDELSFVAGAINSLLDIIQTTQTDLEKRVEQRTSELKAANEKLEQEVAERKTIEVELIANKEHLVRLAHYDNLTSLPNRVFFSEILNKALKHAEKQNKKLAILFIDLDRFKTINDALGHTMGDEVLKQIAKRLEAVMRSGDIIARLGGDEFIILLDDVQHAKMITHIADKVLEICLEPIHVNQHEFVVSASIGICLFPEDGKSLEDLQRHADIAMYKAKRAGGGSYQFFTKEMNQEAHDQIKLESALRKAIANNEFALYYQPKLNLKEEAIIGVEALIRWENPELGIITPSRFIPLAEETGLIMQIGEWVLREACKTNKKWQEEGFTPITMAVNLSPKQFRHQDIALMVATVLKETGLAPQYLELEITESAVMDNIDNAIKKLNEITAIGVKISIDDFGTGYTSLNYLKQFPVSHIKIDQSFIKGITLNANDAAITSAVIAMAHSLNLKVIAEGVETIEQVQYLSEHQCDIIQGYYISRPLPEQKIILQLSNIKNTTESMSTH